MKNMRKRYRIV